MKKFWFGVKYKKMEAIRTWKKKTWKEGGK
jgi:hypothetical protein